MKLDLPDTSLARLEQLKDPFRARCEAVVIEIFKHCEDRAFHPVISETLRDSKRQAQLWAQGRRQKSDGSWEIVDQSQIVTRANAGQSPHEFGYACDVMLYPDVPNGKPLPNDHIGWREMAEIVRGFGLVSGGDFSFHDFPHMEQPGWQHLPKYPTKSEVP